MLQAFAEFESSEEAVRVRLLLLLGSQPAAMRLCLAC